MTKPVLSLGRADIVKTFRLYKPGSSEITNFVVHDSGKVEIRRFEYYTGPEIESKIEGIKQARDTWCQMKIDGWYEKSPELEYHTYRGTRYCITFETDPGTRCGVRIPEFQYEIPKTISDKISAMRIAKARIDELKRQ